MDDFLKDIVTTWSVTQLEEYIEQLEMRMKNTHILLQELRVMRRKKQRKVTPENGQRGGK